MDVMYWTIPQRSGKWRVKDKDNLTNGILSIPVMWIDSPQELCPIPYVKETGEACTRWVEGAAVQQGVAPSKSAWDTQVGGTHYKDMKIQPFQYSMANGLDPMQHTIVKYVSRFRAKNGIQDLEKAKQTIDLLIQWEKDKCSK